MVERRLGRGLEFFLSDAGSSSEGEEIRSLELSRLEPSPFQPRREFSKEDLEGLAQSLRQAGVLQPILVRQAGDRYQIIAGERRWRAALLAGLERIPVLVRQVTDQMAAVYGLVENVQRSDLNAIEKAKAFDRIRTLTKGSQAEVAKQVGLDRSTVTNFLRLLELPEDVQAMVSRGTLTMGHARALLGLAGGEEQKTVAEEILRKKLSVRQVETLVQGLNDSTRPGSAKAGAAGADGSKAAASPGERPVWLNEIEETLVEALGTPVTVRYGRKRSRISIECMGREEFERVYALLKSLGDHELS